MKRRNAGEEEQDVEMNGWNGYGNSDLSPAPTASGPRMRASRPKTVKQTKNGPLTPGPSGNGRPITVVLIPVLVSFVLLSDFVIGDACEGFSVSQHSQFGCDKLMC